MKNYLRNNWLILSILIIGGLVRIYRLNEIPGEIWGDVVVGMEFMEKVLRGQSPFYFVLGNGPFYFYFTSLLTFLTGFNFLTLKFASAFFGTLLIIGGYLLAKELFNKEIGLLTAFLLAVSKWPLIFSRWGLMNILVPTIISFIFYFLVRISKIGVSKDLIFIALLTSIGLYTYPAFIIVPPTVVFIYFLLMVGKRIKYNKNNIKYYLFASAIFITLSIPFLLKFGDFGFSQGKSYIGSKFFVSDGKVADNFVRRLGDNLFKHLIMFNYRGDVVFRVNPTKTPQLDFISGVFLIAGLFYLLVKNKNYVLKLVLLVPLILFQLPSALVINFPMDVPNSTRSIGVLPFLYIIVALGLHYLIKRIIPFPKYIILCNVLLLFLIFIINFKQVFVDYPNGLPDKNVPFGRIIAEKIDTLSDDIIPLVYSCCWGSWGQPESGGIKYALKNTRDVVFIPSNVEPCQYLFQTNKYYLFLDPRYEFFIKYGELCGQKINQEKIISKYKDIVYIGVWNY